MIAHAGGLRQPGKRVVQTRHDPIRVIEAVLGDMVPDLEQIGPRFGRENESWRAQFSLPPAAGALKWRTSPNTASPSSVVMTVC